MKTRRIYFVNLVDALPAQPKVQSDVWCDLDCMYVPRNSSLFIIFYYYLCVQRTVYYILCIRTYIRVVQLHIQYGTAERMERGAMTVNKYTESDCSVALRISLATSLYILFILWCLVKSI